MNIKRYLAATLGMFGFVLLYEGFIHSFLLIDIYQETSKVWRHFDEMAKNIPLSVGFQLVLSAWTAFAFARIYKEGGFLNGLRFGLYFGVFAGILTASWYLWLPVPATLSWSWFLCGIGEGLGSGMVLGSIYRKKKG